MYELEIDKTHEFFINQLMNCTLSIANKYFRNFLHTLKIYVLL